MKRLCHIFFGIIAINLPTCLSATETLLSQLETQLEYAGAEFDDLHNHFPLAINYLIAEYYRDQTQFRKHITSFFKLCPRPSSIAFSLSHIPFLKKLMSFYQHYPDYRSVKFNGTSRVPSIFASLPENLKDCIIKKLSEKPLPHHCNPSSKTCDCHLEMPISPHYDYHTTYPRPLCVNGRGDTLVVKKGLQKNFITCLQRNGTEVPLLKTIPQLKSIPTCYDVTGIWVADNDNLAVVLNCYKQENIPEEIFKPTNIKNPYVCTCAIVDTSQAGNMLTYAIGSVADSFYEDIFKTSIRRLPLFARYYQDTSSLYINTARSHQCHLHQFLVQFIKQSPQKEFFYHFYRYHPEKVSAYYEERPYHVSETIKSPQSIVSLTMWGQFFHEETQTTIPTHPSIEDIRIKNAPILYSQEHNFALVLTNTPTHTAWQLINIKPDKKTQEHQKK